MNTIKKIMPIKYPEITSYSFHTNLFSILSNYEKFMQWLYNYYVNQELKFK